MTIELMSDSKPLHEVPLDALCLECEMPRPANTETISRLDNFSIQLSSFVGRC